MYAIQIQSDADRTLLWQPVPEPICGSGDVIVDVCAAALNRADLFQRVGEYPPPPGASDILGLEIAGEISDMGADVIGHYIGEHVCALLPGGGYSERAVVPMEMLMPVPEGWSFEQAAAMPECFLTCFVNLYMEAGLQPGETVLAHGGASGVGTAAIQLASASGNPIFVTSGSSQKVARCMELGAVLAINYRDHDFAEAVLAHTAGTGVDVILDIVGGDYLQRNLQLLKPKGRLVLISTLGGMRAEIDLRVLMSKRARIIGSILRGRALSEKIQIKQMFMERFWALFVEGQLCPVIDSVFPVEQVGAAQQRMAENRNIGKIVLKIR